ncbi:hypothetical protein Tco_1301317 [Tanacetum coccineum]
MASLDHRLNPLFSIKECMSCGALYTRNCGCSKGSLEDKILVPIPDSSQQNCATCGNPVDGLYCRPCAFINDEYERDCEIKIEQLLQDYNGLDIEMRKKERILMEEKYLAISQHIQSICDDDEDDSVSLRDIYARYSTSKAITPDLPTVKPEDSLIIGDEHLDTILEKESDEVIKSSVENLVPILSESEDFSDNEKLKLNLEIPDTILESLSPSPIPIADSDSLMEEIDLFLASDDSMPPGIEDDDYDSEGDIRFLEELLNNDSLPLPEFESFHFVPSFPRPPPEPPDVEISLIFEPDVPMINNVDELNEEECFDPGGGEIDFSQNDRDDDSFTFVIWIFLPYLTYPEVSPLLSSTKNEDTIYDPGIST